MRILVVEDDSVLAAALTRALTQSAYAVDLVADGESANHALASTPYGLVVLDLALPKVDGLAVLRRLRDRRSTTPVLILTARDTLEDHVTGFGKGRCTDGDRLGAVCGERFPPLRDRVLRPQGAAASCARQRRRRSQSTGAAEGSRRSGSRTSRNFSQLPQRRESARHATPQYAGAGAGAARDRNHLSGVEASADSRARASRARAAPDPRRAGRSAVRRSAIRRSRCASAA
jgi:CheY-like chemotaxis protein